MTCVGVAGDVFASGSETLVGCIARLSTDRRKLADWKRNASNGTGGWGVVVVGGGVAGLYGALCAAAETDVLLISNGPLFASASVLAQGGVAAAVVARRLARAHAEDTIAAGRGLSRQSAVDALHR